ncbi:DUF2254 domain-containing protein [Pontibacter roseus]|uniref:DUF2254 domain-containing protein n=1 Tax=Pontibacter roseus TaxID=336989 RepID=UPI00036C3C23|nr:DUF2254 domain-containing protein [Pontibacter roseus]
MTNLLSRFRHAFQFIVTSIGFYPTLISLLFFALAVFTIYLETQGLSNSLKEEMPFIIITHGETATMILSSIATGVFSLIVFSFTMVMLVLNQASSNFSPRVIPGLISSKSNQKVLGIFMGTLIYTLVVMVNIRSEYYDADLPGLAVFLAMCFTFLCLASFVYFIHSISTAIQIDNILESIYKVTLDKLRQEIEQDEGVVPPGASEVKDWHPLKSISSGYLQEIDREPIIKLCQKHDVVLEFLQPLGQFVVKGIPFARISRKLEREADFCQALNSHINYYQEELTSLNYLYGFKQITESAVKALSPGINDPGTAIRAIDYLTDLLVVRMQLTEEKVFHDEEQVLRLRLDEVKFADLLSLCLGPVRTYGKSDPIILQRLLHLLQNVLFLAPDFRKYIPALHKEALLVIQDAACSIHNPGDIELLNNKLREMNALEALHPKLPLLKVPPLALMS